MNTLFNSALRQSTAIRKDLDVLAAESNPSPALQGQISASLASFSRTVDEYNKLAKQELVEAKQEKAYERVKNFRAETAEYRSTFERIKAENDDRQTTQSRAELLGRRPHATATPENPYANSTQSSSQYSAFQPSSSRIAAQQNAYTQADPIAAREAHAFRESSFASRANAELDSLLDRGRAVLGDLGDQREMLKGTQKKLYDIGATLGISGDTIRRVERRARQDKWIFWAGVLVFFGFCWLVLHYLR